jgi:hypothetical protein
MSQTTLQLIKEKVATLTPTIQAAGGQSLIASLGLVNVRSYNTPRELIYRVKRNPGGTLSLRNKGENIKTRALGRTEVDYKAGTVKLGLSEAMNLSDFIGFNNPNNLNIDQNPLEVAEVALRQFENLFALTNNTIRTMMAFRFARSITLDGISITNDQIFQGLTAPSVSWGNVATANPILDLQNWKANFFGTNKPAQGLTVLASSKQVINILSNVNTLAFLGMTRIVEPGARLITTLPQLNSLLVAHNIVIHEWNEGYYTNHDSSTFGDITYFLPENEITLLPSAYFVRSDSVTGALVPVGPGSSTNPYVDIISVPDSDFMFRPQTSFQGVSGVMAGAAFQTGIEYMSQTEPGKYRSTVSLELGAFQLPDARIASVVTQF